MDSSSAAHPPPRKLLKKSKGPPISFNNRQHQLQRAPSAPTYPSFHRSAERLPSLDRNQSPAAAAAAAAAAPSPSSSQPALRRQISNPLFASALPSSGAASSSSAHHHPQASSAAPSQHSNSLRTTPELVGQPFDAAAINRSIHQAIATQRPSPPSHTLTADPAPQSKKTTSSTRPPKLRQSASFTLARKMNDTITPPRSDADTKSPRQRYSDEADTSKNRKSDGGKKKSTFSSFVKDMLGSPRRPTISTPTNPMHVTHVSIDNETGEYTVRGTSWAPPPVPAQPSPLLCFPFSR